MAAPWNPVPGWDVPRDYYAPDAPTADEDSFEEMIEERMKLYECDCCSKMRPLHAHRLRRNRDVRL